eukprot:scaffold8780_cov130-Isochrysis_galbana.AAC.18
MPGTATVAPMARWSDGHVRSGIGPKLSHPATGSTKSKGIFSTSTTVAGAMVPTRAALLPNVKCPTPAMPSAHDPAVPLPRTPAAESSSPRDTQM